MYLRRVSRGYILLELARGAMIGRSFNHHGACQRYPPASPADLPSYDYSISRLVQNGSALLPRDLFIVVSVSPIIPQLHCSRTTPSSLTSDPTRSRAAPNPDFPLALSVIWRHNRQPVHNRSVTSLFASDHTPQSALPPPHHAVTTRDSARRVSDTSLLRCFAVRRLSHLGGAEAEAP